MYVYLFFFFFVGFFCFFLLLFFFFFFFLVLWNRSPVKIDFQKSLIQPEMFQL